MPSNLTAIEPNYPLNIILWIATLSLHQVIQIPSSSNNIYDSLLTVYDMPSGRPKREFCTDMFRLMISELYTRDVYAAIDDVTSSYEHLYKTVSVIVGFRNLSHVTATSWGFR